MVQCRVIVVGSCVVVILKSLGHKNQLLLVLSLFLEQCTCTSLSDMRVFVVLSLGLFVLCGHQRAAPISNSKYDQELLDLQREIEALLQIERKELQPNYNKYGRVKTNVNFQSAISPVICTCADKVC